ncbi:MAG: ester cyclase [Anaerolineae bacterium]|nr:ester cyclase [Anaerolineae bacterium]
MKQIARMIFVGLMLVMIGAGSVAAQEDNAQRNKQIFLDMVAQYNAGNREAFYSLLTDPFMMNQGDPVLAPMSPDGVRGYDGALAAAMPDIQMNPAVVIAQRDWLAGHITWTGTFTEPFSFAPFGPDPLPPNNQAITWTEMWFLRLNADGLVDEAWVISDPAILFGQVGAFPPREGARTGTPIEGAAGYQTLSADELAASFTSGMEARNLASFAELIGLEPGSDTTGFHADPYVAWGFGGAYSVTAAQAAEEAAFPAMLAMAMPDMTTTQTVTVAEGDWAATLLTLSGTFSEDIEFFGMPLTATGETITWQFGAIDRFDADGKIVEEWIEGDATPLLMGLGIIPAMGS